VAPEQPQEICPWIAEMIQGTFSGNVPGRMHILPAGRSLDWLLYPPELITAGIVTVASFGKKLTIKKIPKISDPTIVIECHLMPIESDKILEEASTTAEFLTKKLKGILMDCELEIQDARLVELPLSSLNEEMRHNEAFRTVLERNHLDIFFDPALWQNEQFQLELEQAIQAELEPDPGGIRRFLEDFEVYAEDLEARWRIALYWQGSGKRVVDFDPLIVEHQETYTKDLLQRLENLQEIPNVDLLTQRRLNLWRQVAESELVDSALLSQRTGLRKSIANYRFQHQGRDYIANQIITNILREEKKRNVRQEAWNSLVQRSSEIAPKMRKLMMKTNAYWQDRGYPNANTPRLQVLGVSEAVVRQVIASIEEETRSAAHSLMKEYEARLKHRIAAWDWRYAATQPRSFEQLFKDTDAISCLKKTYKALEIDVEHLPIQFTGISTVHGISHNAIRVPHDIIFSLGPISGAREYYTLFHVLGEACYLANIDSDLPYVYRRHAHNVLGEGFATLSSWLLWEYDWLEKFTNLAPEQIVEFSEQMRNYELLKLRYYAGFALFEIDAYHALAEDPETDLDKLYGQHRESFLLVPASDQSAWAMNPWLINLQGMPLFTNYVLGLAVAATLIEKIHEKGKSLFSEEFGRLFRSDLVRQGGFTSWLERLQQQNARPLTPFAMSWLQV
jgi:peptidyl-dipeptidase A